MLAVGNLSCSLHGLRSRQRRHPPATPSALLDDPRTSTSTSTFQQSPRVGTTSDATADADADTTASSSPFSSPYGRAEPPVPGPVASLASPADLVPRPQLRSLCRGALRLTATEPDHAAGSAVRALGYLAWGLDPANISSGDSSGGGGGGGDRPRGGSGGGEKIDGLAGKGERCAENAPSEEEEEDKERGGGRTEGGADAASEAGAAVAAAAGVAKGRGLGGAGTREKEDEEDRGLQDKTVLALSTRLALEKESPRQGVGGGGARGGGGGDRRAEIAAAKCR